MADKKQIEQRIKKKEQEIQVLEEQMKEARVYLQALHDVLKMFPKDVSGSGVEVMPRFGSLAAQARDAILKLSRPMHIDEILETIGKELSRENKTAISGSLSAYVRKNEVFTRPGPNTFGLIELQQKSKPSTEEPPAHFGTDQPSAPIDDDIPF